MFYILLTPTFKTSLSGEVEEFLVGFHVLLDVLHHFQLGIVCGYISIVFPLNNCLIGLLVLFFFIFPLLDTTLVFFIFGSPEGLLVLFLVFSDVLVLVTTFMFTSHPLYFLRDAILNCHDRD